MAALKALCAAVPAAVVLKGAGTLVGQRDCPTGLSPLDVPQLAMGGSGDVLAGCTAALLARLQESPRAAHQAACLAVALHAAAPAGYWPVPIPTGAMWPANWPMPCPRP